MKFSIRKLTPNTQGLDKESAVRKFILAAMVSVALVGCKDKGSEFVGEWRSGDENLVVSKVDDGYRVVSKLGNEGMSFLNLDVKLTAESDNALVTLQNQGKALELTSDGSLTSYLRNKPKAFVKAN